MKMHISDELAHGLIFVCSVGGIFGAMCGLLYIALRFFGYELSVSIEHLQQVFAEIM